MCYISVFTFVQNIIWAMGRGIEKMVSLLISVFTLNRLWLRSSKVPGATSDILTWNHDLRGYCYTTATVRNRQDCSYNGQSLAQGTVVAPAFKIQRSSLVVRQHLFFNAFVNCNENVLNHLRRLSPDITCRS